MRSQRYQFLIDCCLKAVNSYVYLVQVRRVYVISGIDRMDAMRIMYVDTSY